MSGQSKIKYGLKNASSFLQQFRQDKYNEIQELKNSRNEKQQTFDNCQIPSSKQSPQSRQKQQQMQHKFKKYNKSVISCFENGQKNSEALNENLPGIGLADLVIKQHLNVKSKIFQQDLVQLQENRDALLEAIQDLSLKIHNLNEMQDKNKLLELENFKNKKQILSLIKEYHDLKLNFDMKKLKAEENLHRKKQKIKTLLQVLGVQNEYIVQSQSWNQYYYELKLNKQTKDEYPEHSKVLQQIFPKAEQNKEGAKKKEKSKNVVDKSALLGDLKNFAKNFKMPPAGSSNQS